jgi:mycothiol synthase
MSRLADGVNLDLVDGLTARGASAEDAKALYALIAAAEHHYDGKVDVSLDDMVVDLARPGFDPSLDCLIVDDGGEAVAWASVHRGRAEADVVPGHHRRGIGTAILAWTERRARELGSATVSQLITDKNADARALFLERGYQRVATSWALAIEFDGPPARHDPPAAVEIRPYDPSTDADAVYRVIEDAFNEWPDREPQSMEAWAAIILKHPSFSPELSRVAVEGGGIVGASMALDYHDAGDGWVQQLATRATHRHRGIARAMLYETFRAFYERGKRRCGLSTNSRTGALSLYERVGMAVTASYTTFAKNLGEGADRLP